LRRRHDSIEAYLRGSAGHWSLQFLRNGRAIFLQTFSNRADAISLADARLQELRRAGWNDHW